MKGNFTKNIIHTFLVSSLSVPISILVSIVVARSLGPEGKGIYAVVTSAMALLIAVGQFGFLEVLLFQMRHDRRQPSKLAANALVIALIGSIIAAGILVSVYPLVKGSFLKGVSKELLWLAYLLVPFNLVFLSFQRLLHLDGLIAKYNLLVLLSSVSTLIATYAMLRVQPGEPGAAVLGIVTSMVLMSLVAVMLVKKKVAPDSWRVDTPLLCESIRQGSIVQGGMILHLLGQYAGIFILNYLLDSQQVGWFSTAVGLSNMMLLVSNSTRTVLQGWMPSASEMPERVIEMTIVFARITVIILCALGILLAVFGLPVIRIMYGYQFELSYSPMLMLLFGVVARGMGQIVVSQLALNKQFAVDTGAAALSLIANIALTWLLIPKFGMYGAALSAAVGNIAQTLFLTYWFIQKSGRSFLEFLPKLSDARLFFNVVKPLFSQRG
ncbi:MAG: oligosaccharide flippase family protein [Nitrospirota bacterium]